MKASKKGFGTGCGHGQHVPDKHDRDWSVTMTVATRFGQSSSQNYTTKGEKTRMIILQCINLKNYASLYSYNSNL